MKAHSKGGRVRKHNTQGVEGSKAHSKGGRVRKTLPKVVDGSKAHSKRKEDRARSTLST